MPQLTIGFVVGSIIVILAVIAISALIAWKSAISYRIKVGEAKVGSAEEKAREIIDDALKTAETKKREALLEAKEENLKAKNDLERETKERRAEIQRYEKRVLGKEETLDKKLEALEKRESKLTAKEADFEKEKQKVEELRESHLRELEKISGLTSEQAKDYLLRTVEEDVKHETAVLVKELERQAKDDADKKAKEYIINAIQKCAADHVSEATISVVPLPSDEMKGRIIGREGRNIRTLENLTGIDLIIDDTPEAVILSGFDPIRREIARIALEKLIVDGRIHPARIEEMVEKAKKEVETMIREEGEAAALEVGVHGIHPELILAVDALAARRLSRLMCTIQMTDTGIVPGSGVGNARTALTQTALGVPVLSIGVPTVVDGATLAADIAQQSGAQCEALDDLNTPVLVTTRDVDQQTADAARVIGYGINLFLHPSLDIADMELFLS